ncbi:MAG TPA: TraB/GumN family protein [Dehalococcoidia bacterium]|nr:TraB/GumN family protein [Dehalococcoidia bacterium]
MILKKVTTAAVFTILVFTLILSASCPSTDSSTDSPSKSFLWEVTSDNTTVYLLGSVHIGKADLYPLSPAIEDAYDDSQYVVVEVDVGSAGLFDSVELLMEKGMYPPGDNLQSNIPADLYSRLINKLEELEAGLFLSMIDAFEPWVVYTMIVDLEYLELGYGAEYGIETYFLNKAAEDGKGVLELESMEFQLDVLDSLPYDLQILLLEDTVYNPLVEFEEQIESMFEVWRAGDVTEMEQMVFGGVEGYPQYQLINEALIDERNFLMVEKLEGYLEDDEVYFVIVGAAHLIGENGLVNLLIEAGYEVEQH